MQRCQLHKRRNVLKHLPEEHQPFMEQKLIAAWNMAGYAEALRALDRIHPDGDMKLRWVASGLLFVEGRFRRLKGYREMPQLMAAVQAASPPPQVRPVAVTKKLG